MNTKKFICLFMTLLLVVLCGCEGYTPAITMDTIPESTGGKDIEPALGEDNVFSLNSNSNYSFNPLIATNHSNQLVCCLVYENMLEIDENFNVIKNVIIDWKHNDDCTYWEFELDTSHTFHDGTPVTGADLRYSLERAVSAQQRYRGRFSSFQGASYEENKLYVTLGIGDSQLYRLMDIPIIKNGTYPDDYPMGSGPYMYSDDYAEPVLDENGEPVPDKVRYTALVPYEGYVGLPIFPEESDEEENTGPKFTHNDVKHPVDIIYLKEYTDAQSTLTAFEDSLIDVVINDPSSYTNIGYASTNEIHTYPTTNMHFVVFNEQSVLGKYSNFRYAMNFAFDRNNLVTLLHGNGIASAIPMYPSCDIYPDDLNRNFQYNLEMCKTVLENAGVKDYDEDGRLEYMSGVPQEIELIFVVCSDSSAKTGVVRRFAEDMDSIGLKVTVKELSWADYMTALEEGNFDMYYGEVKLRGNFDMTELLQVRPKLKEGQTTTNLNYSGSTDEGYMTYIDSYLKSSESDRIYNYAMLADYITQNAMFITIGFEKQQIILHRGILKGVDPNYGNPLFDFVNWEFINKFDPAPPLPEKPKTEDVILDIDGEKAVSEA